MYKEILSTVLDEETHIKTIHVAPQEPFLPPSSRWEALLQALRIKKRRPAPAEIIELKFKRPTMRTFHRISKLVLELKIQSNSEASHFDFAYTNTPILAAIIATAIHNQPGEVPQRLFDAIVDNFTNSELEEVSQQVYRGLDYDPFYNTTVLFLNLKPNDIQETTAPGQ